MKLLDSFLMQWENLSVISLSLHSVYPKEKLFFYQQHPGIGFLLMYLYKVRNILLKI